LNYLAHAFLSNNNKDLLVGNFIADHIRGNDYKLYSGPIIEGITLHRHIDTFTDTHLAFKESKRFFYDGFEKHSGILVDIYFDHLLARNFEKYSDLSLNEFSKRVYKIYLDHQHLLPVTSSRFLDYVVTNNIYSSYSTSAGIKKVLEHLSKRIRHNIQLNDSFSLFEKNEKAIQDNFNVFFKEALQQFVTG
jgi:acyl carrier protein phosphodiesterase